MVPRSGSSPLSEVPWLHEDQGKSILGGKSQWGLCVWARPERLHPHLMFYCLLLTQPFLTFAVLFRAFFLGGGEGHLKACERDGDADKPGSGLGAGGGEESHPHPSRPGSATGISSQVLSRYEPGPAWGWGPCPGFSAGRWGLWRDLICWGFPFSGEPMRGQVLGRRLY